MRPKKSTLWADILVNLKKLPEKACKKSWSFDMYLYPLLWSGSVCSSVLLFLSWWWAVQLLIRSSPTSWGVDMVAKLLYKQTLQSRVSSVEHVDCSTNFEKKNYLSPWQDSSLVIRKKIIKKKWAKKPKRTHNTTNKNEHIGDRCPFDNLVVQVHQVKRRI